MPSSAGLFLIGHGEAAPLTAPADLVTGFFHLVEGHGRQPAAGSEQRGLVDQVRQLGTGETGRATGDLGKVHSGSEFDLLHMHPEDLLAAIHIGKGNRHLAVKAARTEQCGIENIGTVCRGDDDDTLLRIEAIHLHQKLVERLFALVVPAAHAVAAMASDSVDFIDEDEAGSVFTTLFKHVADSARTDPNKHFHEVRTGDGEEWHIRLTGNGAGEQGLAGAGRADHQHTLGDGAAELLELAGIAEEIDDFKKLFLGLLDPGDVFERHLIAVHGQKTCLALAK